MKKQFMMMTGLVLSSVLTFAKPTTPEILASMTKYTDKSNQAIDKDHLSQLDLLKECYRLRRANAELYENVAISEGASLASVERHDPDITHVFRRRIEYTQAAQLFCMKLEFDLGLEQESSLLKTTQSGKSFEQFSLDSISKLPVQASAQLTASRISKIAKTLDLYSVSELTNTQPGDLCSNSSVNNPVQVIPSEPNSSCKVRKFVDGFATVVKFRLGTFEGAMSIANSSCNQFTLQNKGILNQSTVVSSVDLYFVSGICCN